MEILPFYTLHMCTINDNHMMYGSWRIFCPFTVLTTQKIRILKKNKKNAWRYHNFTQVYQKSLSYAIVFLIYGVR